MPSLSSSIVNQKVASVRDVEEALSRQSLYGGDLVTNLLELATVSEERLTLVVAESHELDPAPIGELPVTAESVRRLVPGDLSHRFALYPLEEQSGSLVVAVAEPLPAEIENDLAFSLGVTLVQRIALLVRVRQAIARDYGTPLDRRSLRVLAKLGGMPDPSPSSLPVRPRGDEAVRPPPTVRPDPEGASPSPRFGETSTRTSEPRLPRAPAVPDLTSITKPEPRARSRRLGPFTAAMAEQGLMGAESRDDVVRAFFDFAAQYFDYAALFAVQGDLAEGRDAHGAGAARARVVGIGVPLDLPSAMSRARDAQNFELTRLGSGGLDGALAKDLERRPGRTVLFMPIRVRGRTMLILYGDHGDRDVDLSAVGEVISFAPLVSAAFENLILKRRLREKGGEAPRGLPLGGRVREPTPAIPSVGERAAALASVIEDRMGAGTVRSSLLPRPEAAPSAALPVPSAPPAPLPAPAPPAATSAPSGAELASPLAPSLSVPPAGLVRRVISIGPAAPGSQQAPESSPLTPHVAARNEPPEDGWDEQASAKPPPEPFQRRERGTHPGVGGALERKRLPIDEAPPSSSRPGSLPRLQLVPEAQAAAAAADSSPDISVQSSELFDDEVPPSSGLGVPLAPSSRSLAYSARPLPPRDVSREQGLPSVIVDLANDCRELAASLVKGDPTASDKLVQIGDPAITALVAMFPGPITAELRRSGGEGTSKASECGPILRTLARMGTRPVPFLAVRTGDGDPVIRAWATRLLGEMPSAEAATAVVRRLTDEDAEVRRAALAAGHLLLTHPEPAEAVQAKIAETVSDATRSEESRHALIEALAELRAPLVIPTLVRLLEDGSPDIVRSAQWALSVITRQDFGTKAALWEEWWVRNSGRHRIEWLIDSLLHDNQELRRSAGDELKSLTKEYFGYYDDLPKKERERAQERYRQWWGTKGKARFH